MNRRLDLPQPAAHDVDTDLKLSGNPSFDNVLDARLSRRSPPRGNALMKTKYDPSGNTTRGPIDNCGAARRPGAAS